mmetsp:Transcript_7443/g.19237  ORF Transcript_7443/g.19237 Transcript_7443/m.19237 type:complete len:172 (+) Transcript_7443:124-639(+)
MATKQRSEADHPNAVQVDRIYDETLNRENKTRAEWEDQWGYMRKKPVETPFNTGELQKVKYYDPKGAKNGMSGWTVKDVPITLQKEAMERKVLENSDPLIERYFRRKASTQTGDDGNASDVSNDSDYEPPPRIPTKAELDRKSRLSHAPSGTTRMLERNQKYSVEQQNSLK